MTTTNKTLAFAVALLMMSAPMFGQVTPSVYLLKTGALTAQSASCLATNCVLMPVVTAAGSVGIQIAGTSVGTVSFEGSIDGTNYVAVPALPIAGGSLVTSATSTGVWLANATNLREVRARIGAYTSGTATVTLVRSPAGPLLNTVTLPSALTVTSLTSTGAVAGTTGTFSGAVASSAGVSGTTGTFSAGVSGTTGTFTDAVSGTSGTFTGALTKSGANGQSVAITAQTEITTIAASATSATTMQIPANSIVLGVAVRVTTVIPTASTFTVTATSTATVFDTAAVSVAATSTDAGTKSCPYYNASAQTITITPDGTPNANTGRVRVTIYYILITPPTS